MKGSPLRTKRSGPRGVLWKVFLVIPPEVKARAAHEGLSPAQQAWTLTVWDVSLTQKSQASYVE